MFFFSSPLIATTPSLASHLGPEVDALQRELHTIAKEKDALSLANAGHSRFQFDMAKHLDRLDQIEKEELKVKTGIGYVPAEENKHERMAYVSETSG